MNAVLAALLAFPGLSGQERELQAFVAAPDPAFGWTEKSFGPHRGLDLKSHTWQGSVWRHDVVVVQPDKVTARGAAIIEVTGWEPNQRDYDYAKLLADSSGMPVALLFQIPNQPLWGREEDALIAYTFERFFESGDPTWPLLFPMVKSVKSTMDALQQSTKGSNNPIGKFVVTGASKRGWTSWLVGSLSDDRVVGIAPAVFDNLDFQRQLDQQKSYWDAYSPMIGDYTERGLQDLLGSEPGKRLLQLVDPAARLGTMTIPTLVVTGTNDPYWTIDSTALYWDRMAMPKWSIAVPNQPHVLADKPWWAPTIGAFAAACASGRALPLVRPSFRIEQGTWELRIACEPGPATYRVWKATSKDLHFEKATWSVAQERSVAATDGQRGIWVSGDRAVSLNTAVLVELEFDTARGRVRLTTPVYLAKKL